MPVALACGCSGALEVVPTALAMAHGGLCVELPMGDDLAALARDTGCEGEPSSVARRTPRGDVETSEVEVFACAAASEIKASDGSLFVGPALSTFLHRDTIGWRFSRGVSVAPVRTPTLPPATHTNTFVVGDLGGPFVLIEPATPYAEELERMVAWVRAHEARGGTLVGILATHHHPDHTGGAELLSDALGLPIRGHERALAGLPEAVRGAPVGDGDVIALGETSLRALFTPGHAPGHLCFLEERDQVLIAGDMVAGVGTILVEPSSGDRFEYLASLRRLVGEAPRGLVPAHGGLITHPVAHLQKTHDHRLARERKVIRALHAFVGPARADQLVPDAYADAPESVWPLAALSVEAHLKKLVRDGVASRDAEGRFLSLTSASVTPPP